MRWTIIGITLALALSTACGSSPTAPEQARQTGSLAVVVKDSPFSDARALLVTFTDVSAHSSGGDFMPLRLTSGAPARTCDLKRLSDVQDLLGLGPMPAGHYTELRLVVSAATIYFDNALSGEICAPELEGPAGASAPVVIPSGTIMLNREFDVTERETTTITLDFDGDHSVIRTGSGVYMMKPVISVVSVQ